MKNKNSDITGSRNFNQNHLFTFTKIFKMKKTLFIISLLSIISCNKQTPECDDKDVLLTVKDIILGRKEDYYDSLEMANIEKSIKITNIRQSSRNEENKSCGCDATIELTQPWFNRFKTIRNNYYYTAQKNTEGEIYIELFKQ